MSSKIYLKIWLFVGWGIVVLIVYLSIIPMPLDLSVPGGDKLSHFAAYFVLMWWFTQISPQSQLLFTAMRCVGLGVGLEIVQGFTEGRYFDIYRNKPFS